MSEPVDAYLDEAQMTQGACSSPSYQGWREGSIPEHLRKPHALSCPGPDLSLMPLHLPGWQCHVLPLDPDPAGVNTGNHVLMPILPTHTTFQRKLLNLLPLLNGCWDMCPAPQDNAVRSEIALVSEGSIRDQIATCTPKLNLII